MKNMSAFDWLVHELLLPRQFIQQDHCIAEKTHPQKNQSSKFSSDFLTFTNSI